MVLSSPPSSTNHHKRQPGSANPARGRCSIIDSRQRKFSGMQFRWFSKPTTNFASAVVLLCAISTLSTVSSARVHYSADIQEPIEPSDEGSQQLAQQLMVANNEEVLVGVSKHLPVSSGENQDDTAAAAESQAVEVIVDSLPAASSAVQETHETLVADGAGWSDASSSAVRQHVKRDVVGKLKRNFTLKKKKAPQEVIIQDGYSYTGYGKDGEKEYQKSKTSRHRHRPAGSSSDEAQDETLITSEGGPIDSSGGQQEQESGEGEGAEAGAIPSGSGSGSSSGSVTGVANSQQGNRQLSTASPDSGSGAGSGVGIGLSPPASGSAAGASRTSGGLGRLIGDDNSGENPRGRNHRLRQRQRGSYGNAGSGYQKKPKANRQSNRGFGQQVRPTSFDYDDDQASGEQQPLSQGGRIGNAGGQRGGSQLALAIGNQGSAQLLGTGSGEQTGRGFSAPTAPVSFGNNGNSRGQLALRATLPRRGLMRHNRGRPLDLGQRLGRFNKQRRPVQDDDDDSDEKRPFPQNRTRLGRRQKHRNINTSDEVTKRRVVPMQGKQNRPKRPIAQLGSSEEVAPKRQLRQRQRAQGRRIVRPPQSAESDEVRISRPRARKIGRPQRPRPITSEGEVEPATGGSADSSGEGNLKKTKYYIVEEEPKPVYHKLKNKEPESEQAPEWEEEADEPKLVFTKKPKLVEISEESIESTHYYSKKRPIKIGYEDKQEERPQPKYSYKNRKVEQRDSSDESSRKVKAPSRHYGPPAAARRSDRVDQLVDELTSSEPSAGHQSTRYNQEKVDVHHSSGEEGSAHEVRKPSTSYKVPPKPSSRYGPPSPVLNESEEQKPTHPVKKPKKYYKAAEPAEEEHGEVSNERESTRKHHQAPKRQSRYGKMKGDTSGDDDEEAESKQPSEGYGKKPKAKKNKTKLVVRKEELTSTGEDPVDEGNIDLEQDATADALLLAGDEIANAYLPAPPKKTAGGYGKGSNDGDDDENEAPEATAGRKLPQEANSYGKPRTNKYPTRAPKAEVKPHGEEKDKETSGEADGKPSNTYYSTTRKPTYTRYTAYPRPSTTPAPQRKKYNSPKKGHYNSRKGDSSHREEGVAMNVRENLNRQDGPGGMDIAGTPIGTAEGQQPTTADTGAGAEVVGEAPMIAMSQVPGTAEAVSEVVDGPSGMMGTGPASGDMAGGAGPEPMAESAVGGGQTPVGGGTGEAMNLAPVGSFTNEGFNAGTRRRRFSNEPPPVIDQLN